MRKKTPPPPAPVSVPEVAGLKLSVARKRVRAAGLVTEIKHVPWRLPADTVVSQSPKPGETLKQRDRVLVNVSLGPKPKAQAAVPDVLGQDEETALTTLQQAGFTVDEVEVGVDSADQDGIVQDEQPAGGTNAPAGSNVTIYIGRYARTGQRGGRRHGVRSEPDADRSRRRAGVGRPQHER